MTTNHKPQLLAYTITGHGKAAYWHRIGAAWDHKNGEGLTIELSALPLDGRIVLLPPKADELPAHAIDDFV